MLGSTLTRTYNDIRLPSLQLCSIIIQMVYLHDSLETVLRLMNTCTQIHFLTLTVFCILQERVMKF